MDTLINSINPTFIEHEGFYYLEFEGEFYKGCKRCGGEGHYSHNGEHSRCYACDNTSAKLGSELPSREAAEKWCHQRAVRRDQRLRKAERERLAKVAAMEQNQQDLKAADPEVYEFLMGIIIEDDTQYLYATYDSWAAAQAENPVNLERNGFLRAMAECLRWVAPSKPFTPKMISSVRSLMEKRAQQEAEAKEHPAPTGRVAVTGEIASAKVVENDYGVAYKILVKDDQGFKVWCSLPKAQADEACNEYRESHFKSNTYGSECWFLGADDTDEQGVKGRRITFTATLEPSRDDVSFAFGKRPTKGAWL